MPARCSVPARPTREPSFAISAAQLGLYVFLASLTVLFGASLVGYLVTRAGSGVWRPPGVPGLPAGLWVSSVLVIAISVALEAARVAARKNQRRALRRRLGLGLGLALAFLAAQLQNWREMYAVMLTVDVRSLFPDTFYLLTGLHAAHVIGGLVPLGIVWYRATQNEYSSSRHEGVALCVQYWHFLTAVWAVLFLALKLGSA